MRRLALVLALIAPTTGWAVGTDDPVPPQPTKTTTECTEGLVWDEEAGSCVAPKESSLDDDGLYDAARELAYAGRYDDALLVLAAMSDPQDDRVLTYRGFAHRKKGDMALGMAFYERALTQNPDNLLARSYMGQAFVEQGAPEKARAQLDEIVARGGQGTWPAEALELAIRAGKGFRY